MVSGPKGRELIGGLPLQARGPASRKRPKVIARQIANYIVDSGMEPGTMLPTEKDMVGALGVGRSTLREALRLLEHAVS